MQEQLTQITNNRIEIIERASLPIVKDIENMYKELNDRIVADNDKYNTEKLPNLLSILEKFFHKKLPSSIDFTFTPLLSV